MKYRKNEKWVFLNELVDVYGDVDLHIKNLMTTWENTNVGELNLVEAIITPLGENYEDTIMITLGCVII
jgi:hypothetical protein